MSAEEKLASALATLRAIAAVADTSGPGIADKYLAMAAIVRKAVASG